MLVAGCCWRRRRTAHVVVSLYHSVEALPGRTAARLMTSRTHTRCWYCGAADVKWTREHILSEKNFGGRLVSPDAVCEACNGLAGKIEAMVAGHPWGAEAVAQYMTGPGGKTFPQSRALTTWLVMV